jgi:hypothetical protein
LLVLRRRQGVPVDFYLGHTFLGLNSMLLIIMTAKNIEIAEMQIGFFRAKMRINQFADAFV